MSTPSAPHGIPPMPPGRPHAALLRWRRDQLVAAGYDELTAQRLAADGRVDIHAMAIRKEHDLQNRTDGGPTGLEGIRRG